MPRFLCTGDLHLGAGADLGRTPGERLADQELVWREIVEIAADREVDAILFAGDAFEGPMPTPEHYAAFQRPLRAADCQVIAITGNGKHDAAMRATTAPEVIGADGFDLYRRPELRLCAGTSGATLLVLVPWASVAQLVAASDGHDRGDLNEFAAELVVKVAADLLEEGRRSFPDVPAVLVTHFSISGATLPTGLPTDLLHEPVLDLGALEQLGFDAIVAGHIHKGQEIATTPDEPNMPIFYVGSPLPLNFGEASYEHGVWILEGWEHRLTNGGVVNGFSPEFVPIKSRSFVNVGLSTLRIDTTVGDGLPSSVIGSPSAEVNVRDAFVKVRGEIAEEERRRLDWPAIVSRIEEAGAYRVWDGITVGRDDVVRGDSEVHENLEPLDQLAAYLLHAGVNGDAGEAIVERTARNLEALS